jgi:hypothetical protein
MGRVLAGLSWGDWNRAASRRFATLGFRTHGGVSRGETGPLTAEAMVDSRETSRLPPRLALRFQHDS